MFQGGSWGTTKCTRTRPNVECETFCAHRKDLHYLIHRWLFAKHSRSAKHPALTCEPGARECSFAYRQFNSNFTCGDPTILPDELNHSRNRGIVGHNVRLPRAWQVLDAYASHLMTLAGPEYGSPCETLMTVYLFHLAINL
ncbi:hypothetical protein AVEN_138081-1 [Araneus ventricosus]|uniref:Uncharacterized protein n=1 Tax=Araneus ventricosus TaxID=182803 RepID=A0A4Y2J2K2_ARAVE|nr:hypothetical protein AVEN_138081-1 [Araneus ventricosus]